LVLLCAGCWTPLERKPIFGGEPEAAPERAPAARPRPYRERPAEALVRKLRNSTPAERDEAINELLERGQDAEVVELLVAALDEELLLVDLLEDLLFKLEPGEPLPDAQATDAAWVQPKLSQALERFGRGDLYGALRIADAVLALEPRAIEAERLRRLRRKILDRVVRESVLAADLEPKHEQLGPSDALQLELVLRNQGEEPLYLEEGDDRVLGVLVQSYEELSPGGTRTRIHSEVPLRLPEAIELEPKERVRVPIRLVAPHTDLESGAVGRYHFAGRLRMDTLRVGDRIHSLFLPLPPRELLVLPPEAADLWEEPATAFLRALEDAYATINDRERAPRARLRLFAAGLLAVQVDSTQGLSAIFSALETSRGELSRTLCALLSAVTREALGFSREEWLAWWRSDRARPLREEPRAE